MTSSLGALAGVLAGMAQASLLGRAASRGPSAFGVLLRLSLVAAVLLCAARSGMLGWTVFGWSAGFVATAPLVYRRLR